MPDEQAKADTILSSNVYVVGMIVIQAMTGIRLNLYLNGKNQ